MSASPISQERIARALAALRAGGSATSSKPAGPNDNAPTERSLGSPVAAKFTQ